jgi:hypothetical protein
MGRARTLLVLASVLLIASSYVSRPAQAAWPGDPAVNVPITTAAGDQSNPNIAPDGAGGAIVAWEDGRGGVWNVYARRVSAVGTPLWTADGVPITASNSAGGYDQVAIVPDGFGGAVLCWVDYRGGGIALYVQRVSGAGVPLWTSDGVPVISFASTATNLSSSPALVADGAGGAIVVWHDDRNGIDANIFAQHVTAAGVVDAVWPAAGLLLCGASGDQTSPHAVSDGQGGAIMEWLDARGADYDIYANRARANGTLDPAWPVNGRALVSATGDQLIRRITTDGAGGAIVAWEDGRAVTTYHVYAQRVLLNGGIAPGWPTDGRELCPASSSEQSSARLASDGAGGAIVAWNDYRNPTSDLFAAHVTAGGSLDPLWPASGLAVCTTDAEQYDHQLAPDGAGGAIIVWQNFQITGTLADIAIQRVLAGGAGAWTANGVSVCIAAGDQANPVLVSYGASGTIVTWDDLRGADYDLYAQFIRGNGQLGGDALAVPGDPGRFTTLQPVAPNPSRGGPLHVRFTLGSSEPATLELLDVAGRRVEARDVAGLGVGTHGLDLGADAVLPPGLYLVRLRQGTLTRTTRAAVVR